jgi:hypothetical protein
MADQPGRFRRLCAWLSRRPAPIRYLVGVPIQAALLAALAAVSLVTLVSAWLAMKAAARTARRTRCTGH